MKFSTVTWILTGGLQFVVGWWYRKSAVFYLPPGWFGPLTWWLSFPFAPTGSVSCGVWQMACRRVIKVGERVVKELMEGETFVTALSLNLDPGSWSLRINDSWVCSAGSAETSVPPKEVVGDESDKKRS